MQQGHFGTGSLDKQRFKRDNGARPFAARPVAFFYDLGNTSSNHRGDRLVEQAFISVYHEILAYCLTMSSAFRDSCEPSYPINIFMRPPGFVPRRVCALP
jgi:hypothetical protein